MSTYNEKLLDMNRDRRMWPIVKRKKKQATDIGDFNIGFSRQKLDEQN
jgi:hypothetical protein